MGFLSASASISYFRVNEVPDPQRKYDDLAKNLAAEGFQSIENSGDETAIGWVELDDHESSDFAIRESCWRDETLCFSLRQDRRRVPAALLKREIGLLYQKFLSANPGLRFVPKGEKEQLRDQAKSQLLVRTLPVPATYDVTWETESRLLRLCSHNQGLSDSFQDLFQRTFPGFRLQLLTPMARAFACLDEEDHEAFKQADQAQTSSILEQIEANRWLGFDFLQWLLYATLNSDSGYQVSTAGPLLAKQPFTAYLDNRVVLIGGGQEGQQKIVVAGQQDHYREVIAAMRQGKQIEEATLFFEQDEDSLWKLTLKGDRFLFGSFRTPMVKPEKDPDEDPLLEKQAAFFTKMVAVNEGEQMFDSLLKTFLKLRLSEQWTTIRSAINSWLTEE